MNDTFEKVLEELNKVVPEDDYRNAVIATFFKNNRERLTEEWLHNALLRDVEDDFISHEQAIEFEPVYIETIDNLKKIF